MPWTYRGMARVKTIYRARVGEIVKRYSIKEEAAQREVDILMDGRNLGP